MSGGLYSTSTEQIDKTFDPKRIKPYGDTMNDGKTQLSFTLPVPAASMASSPAGTGSVKLSCVLPSFIVSP